MSKRKKWNQHGIRFEGDESLFSYFIKEHLYVLGEHGSDEDVINHLRDCQTNSLDLFLAELELMGSQNEIAFSAEETLSFLRLHAYCALIDLYHKANHLFKLEKIPRSQSQDTLLFGKNYHCHYLDVLGDYKEEKVDPALFYLNRKYPSLFTDELFSSNVETQGISSIRCDVMLGVEESESTIWLLTKIKEFEAKLDSWKSFATSINGSFKKLADKYLGIGYENILSLPKILMHDEMLTRPGFRSFDEVIDGLNKFKNIRIYGSEEGSQISTKKPIIIKKSLELFRDKGLISIDDENILRLIRCLFSIPKKYFAQYPDGIAEFSITSTKFSINLKALLRELRNEGLIEGSPIDIGMVVNKFFPNEGLNPVTIKNSLKPSSVVQFNGISKPELIRVLSGV